jgi:anaerobic magnesium-protoporphyrin IX monomethyl ester cyclase
MLSKVGNSTRVLLINPPTMMSQFAANDTYLPTGLLYLATVLKKEKYDVRIIDVNNYFYKKELSEDILTDYVEQQLLSLIKEYAPGIIGIGCLFSGVFKGLVLIAKAIKQYFPDLQIVVGGIHPTIFACSVLRKYKCIDYVIIGEGEFSFLQLCKIISGNDYNKISKINGIAFRKNGSVYINKKTKFISRLDVLPLVDYSLINVSEYNLDTKKWYNPKKLQFNQPFPIITSRSCPRRCNFCSMRFVHGPKIRFRSAENVLEEIEKLYTRYNARYFHIMDDNMTFDKRRILEICNGVVRRNLNIHFDAPNGFSINTLDEEIVAALVEAGMVRISLAVESGSDFIRNRIIGKGLSAKKIFEVFDICAKYKELFIVAFFIIGMPEETIDTLEETYKLVVELPIDSYGMFYATPYPGTRLFDYCVENNLISGKAEHYLDFGEFYHITDKPHFKPHDLTVGQLIGFKRKCEEYREKIRTESNLPSCYPLRY